MSSAAELREASEMAAARVDALGEELRRVPRLEWGAAFARLEAARRAERAADLAYLSTPSE